MAQPSNQALIEFIQNSEVSHLTSGGVNNICILLVENNIPAYHSKYIDYDFDTHTIIPLTKICIKLVFLSGGKKKIEFGDKQSISEELIRKEATNQNIIYKKSIKQFEKPICPPILSVNISKGLRIDILSAILSRMKRDTKSNRKIYKDLSRFLEDKKNYPIGFITMGYIPKWYKTLRDWIRYLPGLSLNLSKKTYYTVFKELFKLHYLGFQHCDFNPDNILICNPFVISSTTTDQSRYNTEGEALLRTKIQQLKGPLQIEFLKDKEQTNILDVKCNTINCIIIDFGTLYNKQYDSSLPIYNNLRCDTANDDELLLKLYIKNTGDSPELITSEINKLLEEEGIDLHHVNNNAVENLKVNTIKDKLNDLDTAVCEEYIKRQDKLHDIVSSIRMNNNSPISKKIIGQLEKLSQPVIKTPVAQKTPPLSLFGNNEFSGGGEKDNLQIYLKSLTYNFIKRKSDTRKKY